MALSVFKQRHKKIWNIRIEFDEFGVLPGSNFVSNLPTVPRSTKINERSWQGHDMGVCYVDVAKAIQRIISSSIELDSSVAESAMRTVFGETVMIR